MNTSKKKAARCTGNAGEFVTDLIGYQKATKMSSTYVGKQDDLSGFWKYLDPYSRIYPSYMLHRTVTGRTASADPNGHNFPNRGTWAEQYQKIFIPTPGFKLVSCDLSQIELRLVAWMAAEAVMMQIYADNGDIHAATAAMAMGITLEEFNALPETVRKEARRNAKPAAPDPTHESWQSASAIVGLLTPIVGNDYRIRCAVGSWRMCHSFLQNLRYCKPLRQ